MFESENVIFLYFIVLVFLFIKFVWYSKFYNGFYRINVLIKKDIKNNEIENPITPQNIYIDNLFLFSISNTKILISSI